MSLEIVYETQFYASLLGPFLLYAPAPCCDSYVSRKDDEGH